MLDAIGNDPTVMGIFSLLVESISLTVVSAVFAHRYTGASADHGRANRLSDLINDKNTVMASVILLITIALMLVAFLVKNADASASDNYAELNQKMSVFFLSPHVDPGSVVCLASHRKEKRLVVVRGSFIVFGHIGGLLLCDRLVRYAPRIHRSDLCAGDRVDHPQNV